MRRLVKMGIMDIMAGITRGYDEYQDDDDKALVDLMSPSVFRDGR